MLNPGGANGNNIFPGFMENNMFPQLQLFGQVTVNPGGGPGTVNYMSTIQAPVENTAPISRAGAGDAVCIQQKLPITNSNYPSKSIRIGSALNRHPVSTGLKLSCEEDERNSTLTSAAENVIPLGLSLGNAVKTELHRQREELTQFIKLQEQNIMKGVHEMSQRHTVSLLTALEKGINQKLHEKDVEIENMNKKNRELTEKIKQVALEAQSRHCKAKYNESVVNTLKSNIQKLMAHGIGQAREGSGDSELDDAISCSNNPQGPGTRTLLTCRACNMKEVSVLIMPCRHLCVCSDCDGFVNICPICQVMKTAGLHVYM